MKHFSFLSFRVAAVAALLTGAQPLAAQDLLQELEKQTAATPKAEYAEATFKSVRVMNGHSVETASKGTLHFLIGHRFGTLNSGAYEFFGLDNATIRLGLEYGFTRNLTIGIGRSSFQKTYDGFIKYRAIRQGKGPGTMPFTVTLLATSAISTQDVLFNGQPEDLPTRGRVTYTYQALLARKFSDGFSLQLMPTWVHRNLVQARRDENDVLAVGAAARQKITKRLALTAEYYYLLPGQTDDDYRNSLAVGFDIETGGHVFQLHLTNSQGMVEKFFVPQTTGNFFDGDIYFGFNISRAFTLGRH